MFKKISFIGLNSLIFLSFLACATTGPRNRLDQLFMNNFEDLSFPDIDTIKERGFSKKFPYVTFEETWDSAILVLMQKGIVISQLEQQSGIIAAISKQPFLLFIEKKDEVISYFYWFDELNRGIANLEKPVRTRSAEDSKKIAEDYLGQLATQVYSGQKWKYLNEASTQK